MRFVWILLVLWVLLGAAWWSGTGRSISLDQSALKQVDRQLEHVAELLRNYQIRNGRYPDNDEGLDALVTDPDDQMGVLKVLRGYYRVPIMYENRRGLAIKKFAFSLATDNTDQTWCTAVDEGIYIYSLSARSAFHRFKKAITIKQTGYLILSTAGLFCFIMFCHTFFKKPRITGSGPAFSNFLQRLLGYGLLGGMLFSILPHMMTCYRPRVFYDDPKTIEIHEDLLDKFVSEGVIKKETAEKLKKLPRL
jgi:type II secretory pathway pseudopilin PulG